MRATSATPRHCARRWRPTSPISNIGWNEPYSALNGVTYTLEHHGDGRGLDATMIEIRHDEILEPVGVELWSQRLARTLAAAAGTLGKFAAPVTTPESRAHA